MSHRERNKSDRGRTRSIKARDRAQMCFDDLLIDEYLNDEDAADIHEREVVKVRYGVQRLADHLSDSTIAYHVLGLGDDAPETETSMELDVIDDAASLLRSPHVEAPPLKLSTSSKTTPVADHASPNHASVNHASVEPFSLTKMFSGMAYGAAAGLGLLLVMRMLF